MRAINSAQVTYSSSAANGGFATSLTILATPCLGAAGFISPDLDPSLPSATPVGTGLLKSGYEVDLVAAGAGLSPDCNGTPTTSDYVATAGTLSFPAGTTSRSIVVSVNGDTVVEPNETFFLNVSNPAGATVADGQGRGTILDDDAPPRHRAAGH